MYFFYSFCFTAGFLLALPYFLFQAMTQRKYFSTFFWRLGFLPKRFELLKEDGIWIHAVSVGEVMAILPLIALLRSRWPSRQLWVSTTTVTGYSLATSKLAGNAEPFYFPLDWGFVVRRVLAKVRPAVVLVAETEIWPNFLHQCERRGIPVVLINGRLSDRSVRRYRRVRGFMTKVLSNFDYCCMQTDLDSERLRLLGKTTNVEICGNLKYDIALPQGAETRWKEFRELLNLDTSSFVVVAGSTMKGEEVLVFEAFSALRAHVRATVLILAPRHPGRMPEIETLLQEGGFQYCRRSELGKSDHERRQSQEIVLLDTMGELALVYGLGDLVFVGGSLVPTGGHNILEPALFRKPVLFGPHMNNFREIAEDFLKNGAAIRVNSASDLGAKLIQLYGDETLRLKMGETGHALMNEKRGAAKRIVRRLETVLSPELCQQNS